jgi:hypothetical protein
MKHSKNTRTRLINFPYLRGSPSELLRSMVEEILLECSDIDPLWWHHLIGGGGVPEMRTRTGSPVPGDYRTSFATPPAQKIIMFHHDTRKHGHESFRFFRCPAPFYRRSRYGERVHFRLPSWYRFPHPDPSLTTAVMTTSPPALQDCLTDDDCVPAECCHPASCINKVNKGVCSLLCTNVCEGPIDCGAGRCGCVNGKCSVVPTGSSPLTPVKYQLP